MMYLCHQAFMQYTWSFLSIVELGTEAENLFIFGWADKSRYLTLIRFYQYEPNTYLWEIIK